MSNDELDAKVLKAIKVGVVTFTAITVKVGSFDHFRAVDRSLQRLRKKGKIKFDTKKGWALLPQEK